MNDLNSAAMSWMVLAIGICFSFASIGDTQEYAKLPAPGQYIEVANQPGGKLERIQNPRSFHSAVLNFDKVIIDAARRRDTTQSLAWADALRIAQRMVVIADKPDGAVTNFPVAKHHMVVAATAERIEAIKRIINQWAKADMTVEQIVSQWNEHRSLMVQVQATIVQMPQHKFDEFKRALIENDMKMESLPDGPVTMFGKNIDRKAVEKVAKQVDVDVISSPRLVTIIGKSARIMTGAEIPMVTQKVGEVEFKHLGTRLDITPDFPLYDPFRMKLFVKLHDQLLLQKPAPDNAQPGFWSRGLQACLQATSDQTVMLVYDSKNVTDPKLPAHEAEDVVKAIFFTANRVTHTAMPRK